MVVTRENNPLARQWGSFAIYLRTRVKSKQVRLCYVMARLDRAIAQAKKICRQLLDDPERPEVVWCEVHVMQFKEQSSIPGSMPLHDWPKTTAGLWYSLAKAADGSFFELNRVLDPEDRTDPNKTTADCHPLQIEIDDILNQAELAAQPL